MSQLEEITILRAAYLEDEYGDPVPDTYQPVHTISARFAPNNPSEPVEVGRNAVITGGTVYWRTETLAPVIESTDQVEIRGQRLSIDGDIGIWKRSRGWGIQFAVKKLTDKSS